jgi:hypothetical protein
MAFLARKNLFSIKFTSNKKNLLKTAKKCEIENLAFPKKNAPRQLKKKIAKKFDFPKKNKINFQSI